jgi:hypothetical protein
MSSGANVTAAQLAASGLGIVGQGQSTLSAGNVAALQGAGSMGSNATSAYGTQANAYAQANDDGGLMSALGTLGGAAIMASDRRLKRYVRKVCEDPRGFGWYEFEYIWGGGKRVGVMAQEVQEILPQAVSTVNGYLAVNYSML